MYFFFYLSYIYIYIIDSVSNVAFFIITVFFFFCLLIYDLYNGYVSVCIQRLLDGRAGVLLRGFFVCVLTVEFLLGGK